MAEGERHHRWVPFLSPRRAGNTRGRGERWSGATGGGRGEQRRWGRGRGRGAAATVVLRERGEGM